MHHLKGKKQDFITGGDAKDVRLVHLIRFYNIFCGAYQSVYGYFQMQSMGVDQPLENSMAIARGMLDKVHMEKAYLQAHPQGQ